ncbi:hypothetical protein [Vibrio sinaloensis]|uniref:hypothetical protein n=1 Tax=Photobacterium sp. (strain ATCC 43367) TaxID=379097 RepID=UPI002057E157|nr:hypothetical protein [Vibrio sinaloensis]UPQ89124.1 hypothetical protein MTO69_06225 [Vibrio sinaloensis]
MKRYISGDQDLAHRLRANPSKSIPWTKARKESIEQVIRAGVTIKTLSSVFGLAHWQINELLAKR